jgi:hypothetical protein
VQATAVVPIANCEPDPGVHAIVATPLAPVTVGSAKRTTAFSLLPFAVTDGMTGHAIVNGSSGAVGGGVGLDGGDAGFLGGSGAGAGVGNAFTVATTSTAE